MGCNGSINAWDKTERTTVPPYRSSLVYQKPARLSRLVDQWLFGDDFLRRPFHGVLLSLRVYLNTLIRSFGTTLSFLHLSNLHKRVPGRADLSVADCEVRQNLWVGPRHPVGFETHPAPVHALPR
jgi:hypothetical protein